MSVTLADIRAARERIKPFIYHSPCPYSLRLSRLCGAQVYCKLDHLQMTGSFKERGARNRLMLLTAEERARGVIAVSAGNHALGLAYHGQELGIPVTVVMPKWAPLIKVATCRSFGANVIQEGETFALARTMALELAEKRSLVFVPPYDDEHIINGQGSLGLEILEDVPDLDAVLVPVGGGGLISGIATAMKALKPSVRIIGVEARSAPTMHASLAVGHPEPITAAPTLADGLAVAKAGDLCYPIAKQLVDEFVLVDEAQIAQAILRLLELEKIVVEGAGAVPLAALMTQPLGLAGKKVVLLLCGGNIDVTMIARVIDRGLAADGRLCRFEVLVSDRPGNLARVLTVVAAAGASVKEVHHDRNFGPADVARVGITIVAETRDHAHIQELHAALREATIEFTPH
ncbi:MAG: threonine ammonia-lyase [Planctomycetes bacterium]|nr:threonine ammonia-lyase [Planctomycetota bacterium]